MAGDDDFTVPLLFGNREDHDLSLNTSPSTDEHDDPSSVNTATINLISETTRGHRGNSNMATEMNRPSLLNDEGVGPALTYHHDHQRHTIIHDADTNEYDAQSQEQHGNGDEETRTRNDDAIDNVLLPPEHEHSHLQTPSGIAGAVVGMFVGGPIVSAIVGFGSAYAVRKQGTGGDIARSLGEVALKAQEKAAEVEEKHKIVQTAQLRFQELRRSDDHLKKLVVSATDTVQMGLHKAIDYGRRQKLLQQGMYQTGRAIDWVEGKVCSG
eukprot:CAMPEP_0119558180 /NCGR_PEP_ID=MMETSP1352-20130426/10275_1 /TAXON_ID=265584 /ORGANISM="Stauroneis constricta, Strain CCMP1120" /LENGTH=267 /DNA_ID=CAMNT_0007605455 /DNA_START=82 /DNA_END=885 /DNA_ORIENTATION=+